MSTGHTGSRQLVTSVKQQCQIFLTEISSYMREYFYILLFVISITSFACKSCMSEKFILNTGVIIKLSYSPTDCKVVC